MSYAGDKMKSRLLNQFTVSTDFLKLIDAFNDRFDDSDNIIDYLLYYTMKDTAQGVWLDDVGLRVGLERPYIPSENIFEYRDLLTANDPDKSYRGMGSSVGGTYQGIYGTPSAVHVDDAEYLKVINAKIFAKNVKPTVANIYTFIKDGFDTLCTITTPSVHSIQVDLATTLNQYHIGLIMLHAPVAAGKTLTIINP